MYQPLGRVTLKTHETMRVASLRAPAGRFAKAIRAFLGHKGHPWLLHVDLANEGQTDALQTAYTIGLIGREIAGNVMIVSDGRVGILGHVFTAPPHRRKGICQALMAAAVDGFRGSGGLALSLGTGYDSPAYWIYHSLGFRGIEPANGHMLFESREGGLGRYFAPGPVRVEDVRWEHWAGISLLFSLPAGTARERAALAGVGLDPRYTVDLPAGDAIRSYAYGVYGPVGFEGGFLHLMADRARLSPQAKVLVSRAGSVVGAAILQPDSRWPGRNRTLDLFVHPNFAGAEPKLLRALKLPPGGKVQAYLDHPSASRASALAAAGFRREAILRRQLDRRGHRTDVLVFAHGEA
jgi:GNAT superfamily N-acetyltransferase